MDMIECGNGTLREIARGHWGQLTLRTVRPDCEAGGHRHPNTEERWWIVAGRASVTLDDVMRRQTFRVSPNAIVHVKPGVWHSVRNDGEEDVVFVFWSDKTYEEQEKIT